MITRLNFQPGCQPRVSAVRSQLLVLHENAVAGLSWPTALPRIGLHTPHTLSVCRSFRRPATRNRSPGSPTLVNSVANSPGVPRKPGEQDAGSALTLAVCLPATLQSLPLGVGDPGQAKKNNGMSAVPILASRARDR